METVEAAPPAPTDDAPEADEPETATGGDDELLLDSDDILTTPVGAPPIAPPEDDDAAQPPVAGVGGGTLFERMSNIARGAPKAQIGEDDGASGFREEPFDIPRFLNRQNNQ